MDSSPWGNLINFPKELYTINLYESQYSSGRTIGDSDIHLGALNEKIASSISAKHFIISRELPRFHRQDPTPVFITDVSTNGTYLNNQLIGKGNRRIIKTNDVISVLKQKIKLYRFTDNLSIHENNKFPEEFTRNYFVGNKPIGRGGGGTVYKALDCRTLEKFAIKVVKKDPLVGEVDEMTIMRQLDHPCIIKMFDASIQPTKLFIRMEFLEGGTLDDRIIAKGQLEENMAKFFFCQLTKAVEYLHDRNIAHRDLKTKNIVLASSDDYTRLKVIDFGLSKTDSKLRSICGTTVYVTKKSASL